MMTWSLKLNNGDIGVTGGVYDTVTGPEKQVQDLKCWILEPQGNDVMHPDYGSIMTVGGTAPDGTFLPTSIGGVFSSEDLMRIEAEVRRVVGAYQALQKDRLTREAVMFAGKNTFSPGEICLGIRNVSILQIEDTALCLVSILAGNGDVLAFTV